jgi:WD40 repeat protein
LIRLEPYTHVRIGGARLLTISKTATDRAIVRSWAYDGTDPRVVGTVHRPASIVGRDPTTGKRDAIYDEPWARELNPAGSATIFSRNGKARRLDVGDRDGNEHLVWSSAEYIKYAYPSHTGKWIAGVTLSGILLKSIRTGEERQLKLRGDAKTRVTTAAEFDNEDRRVAWSEGIDVSVWDLEGPPDADARLLRNTLGDLYIGAAFHPNGALVATVMRDGVAFWPLAQPEAFVFSGDYDFKPQRLAFTPDGRWLVVCAPFQEGITFLPLRAAAGRRHQTSTTRGCYSVGLHPDGNSLVVGHTNYGVASVQFDGSSRVIAPNPVPPLGIFGTAYHPGGRSVVAIMGPRHPKGRLLQVDASTGMTRSHALPAITHETAFDRNGTLYSAGEGGIRVWNLETGTQRVVYAAAVVKRMRMSGDGRYMLAAIEYKKGTSPEEKEAETQELRLFDIAHGTSRVIGNHGSNFTAIAIDRSGSVIATGDPTGTIRVGRASGEEPHLLSGHRGHVVDIVFSEDARQLASAGADATARVWPAPDLASTPFHRLRHDVLIARLHRLTNVRVIADSSAPAGYRVGFEAFPGWRTIPTW